MTNAISAIWRLPKKSKIIVVLIFVGVFALGNAYGKKAKAKADAQAQEEQLRKRPPKVWKGAFIPTSCRSMPSVYNSACLGRRVA